jgi:hypothetical protein
MCLLDWSREVSIGLIHSPSTFQLSLAARICQILNPWTRIDILKSSIGPTSFSRCVVTLGANPFFRGSYPYRITAPARSRTSSSRYLDANSNSRLKSSQICSSYLLGLLRVLKAKLKNILSYLKDTRRTTLLAC